MRSIEATLEQYLNYRAVLADRNLPEVPVIFVKGESMSLLEAKWQVREFLVFWNPVDLDESLEAASENVVTISGISSDLQGGVDWYLADSTVGPDLGRPASICGDYERVLDVCSVGNESVPSSEEDFFP